MKKICLVVLLAMVALGVQSVEAQQRRGGVFFTIIEQNDDTGWGPGVKYEQDINERFVGEARLSYIQATDSDDDTSVIPLEFGALARFPSDTMELYAGGGIGYYMYDLDIPGGYGIDDPSEFGFYIMGGIRAPISPTAMFFAEGKFTQAEFEETSDVERFSGPGYYGWRVVSVEGGLDGFGANLGVLWMF